MTLRFAARLGWLLVVATAGIALGVHPSAGQPGTAGEDGQYVNMGDSFAAGAGILPVAPGADPRCLQSELGYARLVAADRGYALTDASCAGADTDSFHAAQSSHAAPQLDALTETTDLVTIMIGGNDNSIYGNLARICMTSYFATPAATTPCLDQLGDAPPRIEAILPNIVTALDEVHRRAPHARVFITGYPWVLPERGGCPSSVPMAPGDVPYLHEVQARLNSTIRLAAESTGTTFVDMAEVSWGRDACAAPDQRWVEPAIGFRDLSILHTNAAGQRAIANQLLAAIGS